MDNVPLTGSSHAAKRKRAPGSKLQLIAYNPNQPVNAPRITEEEWLCHRLLLEKLHIEGRSRQDMQKVLAEHGLSVTLAQLNSKMTRWGYRVYESHKANEIPTQSNQHATMLSSQATQIKNIGDVATDPESFEGCSTFVNNKTVEQSSQPHDALFPIGEKPDVKTSPKSTLPAGVSGKDAMRNLLQEVRESVISDTLAQFAFGAVDVETKSEWRDQCQLYMVSAVIFRLCGEFRASLYFSLESCRVIKDMIAESDPDASKAVEMFLVCFLEPTASLLPGREMHDWSFYALRFKSFLDTIKSLPDSAVNQHLVSLIDWISAFLRDPSIRPARKQASPLAEHEASADLGRPNCSLSSIRADQSAKIFPGIWPDYFLGVHNACYSVGDPNSARISLRWCQATLRHLQGLLHESEDLLQGRSVEELPALYIVLLFYHLRQKIFNCEVGKSFLQEPPRMDCHFCVLDVILRLASMALLIVNQLIPSSSWRAVSYCIDPSAKWTFADLSSALDELWDMRPLAFRAAYLVAYNGLIGGIYDCWPTAKPNSKPNSYIQDSVVAFSRHLAASRKRYDQPGSNPCKHFRREESFEAGNSNESRDLDSCSIVSGESSSLASMRRISKRTKATFGKAPSVESFGEFMRKTITPQISPGSGILWDRMSILSVEPAETVSIV